MFVKLKEGSYVYRKKDPLYTLYKRNSCKNTKLLRKRIYCFVETLQTPLIKLSLRVVNERKLWERTKNADNQGTSSLNVVLSTLLLTLGIIVGKIRNLDTLIEIYTLRLLCMRPPPLPLSSRKRVKTWDKLWWVLLWEN